jgi:molybdopterin synthase sulfur carrier subunit
VVNWSVRVRFFASLREALGDVSEVRVPEGSTVGHLRQQLIGLGEAHARALGPERVVRCAVNQSVCAESTLLFEGAEVAFFPPINGG